MGKGGDPMNHEGGKDKNGSFDQNMAAVFHRMDQTSLFHIPYLHIIVGMGISAAYVFMGKPIGLKGYGFVKGFRCPVKVYIFQKNLPPSKTKKIYGHKA